MTMVETIIGPCNPILDRSVAVSVPLRTFDGRPTILGSDFRAVMFSKRLWAMLRRIVSLGGVAAAICAQAAAQALPSVAPTRASDAGAVPIGLSIAIGVDERPRDLHPKSRAESELFIKGWRIVGRSAGVDPQGHGFNIGASSDLRGTTNVSSNLDFGSTWRVSMKATTDGPAGLHFTARVGARNYALMPTFLTDVIGTDTVVSVHSRILDSGRRETTWDAAFQVERDFTAGAVDVRVFGEALVAIGALGSGRRMGPEQQLLSWDGSPVRPTDAAIRWGVGLGF
jgi:hypothetical protein